MNDPTSSIPDRRRLGALYPGRVALIRVGVAALLVAVTVTIMSVDGPQGRWALLLLIPAAVNLWFAYYGFRRAHAEASPAGSRQ